MANLKEQDKWEDGVYQIEENDPVLGGENGITNKPIKQLANRTSWLKKALELLGKKSAPKDLTEDSESATQADGHTHALPSASTTAKGIVKLNSATNSASETEAATPKAVKSVNDKLTGFVPYSSNLKNYATVVPSDAGYGGYEMSGGKNGHVFRMECEDNHFKFWSRIDNTPYAIHAPAKRNGTMALMDDVNAKVSKSGDAMNGILFIDGAAPGGFANGLVIRNKAGGQNTSGFVDFYQSDTVPRSSIWFRDAGDNSTQIEFLNTPEGADWNRDSREVALTLKSTGALWSKQYGWLHDHFAKQGDINNVWKELNNTYRKNRFRHQYYPNHYQGAEVYDIPVGDNGVMRIIIMRVTINGYAK